MYSIGVSCYFHDSAIAVLKDGELVFFCLEDRFSRLKHDDSFPELVIKYLKNEKRIILEDENIDSICFYEGNERKFISLINEILESYPFSYREFFKVIPQWVMKKFWIKSKLALSFGVEFKKIKVGNHHLSHALYGHYSSQNENSIVVCSDGYGDRASLTIYTFKQGKHEKLLSFDKDKSLGLIYTAFTTFMGFKANDGECSLMAISRFGNARYRTLIEEVISLGSDEIYSVNSDYFNFSLDAECFYSELFIEKFGLPFKRKFSVSSFESTEVSQEEQYYLDLAASFHLVFEEIYEVIFKTAHKLSGIRNFVFSGGVAQNCVLVSRLKNLSVVDDIHIPLDPGDGGGAIGAAIYGSDAKEFKVDKMFAGPRLSSSNISDFLNVSAEIRDLKVEEREEQQLIEGLYESIKHGDVIALFSGAMEVGPRALGHRSLICRPDSERTVDKLSNQIKSRAAFRPYALIMTEDDAKEMIEGYGPSSLVERMQTVVSVKNEFRKQVHYGLHIDGTTRVQVVKEEDNSLLYKLLCLKKEREGRSCLINTSFNQSGLPLIQSPVDALFFFKEKPLGAMVIENLFVTRK